jgi:hypothetical protein
VSTIPNSWIIVIAIVAAVVILLIPERCRPWWEKPRKDQRK